MNKIIRQLYEIMLESIGNTARSAYKYKYSYSLENSGYQILSNRYAEFIKADLWKERYTIYEIYSILSCWDSPYFDDINYSFKEIIIF